MRRTGTSSDSLSDEKNEGGDITAFHDSVAVGSVRVCSYRHTNNNGEFANDVPEVCAFFMGS